MGVMNLEISMTGSEKRDTEMVDVPPMTRTCSEMDYKKWNIVQLAVKKVIKKSENVILIGDFNWKVHREDWSKEEGRESWGGKLLGIIMDKVMTG